MVDNTQNNWKDFSASCIAYFIMMIIYVLIGVDLIILSKEFSIQDNDYKSVTYIDYLYPTDGTKPPYTGKYDAKQSSQSTTTTTSNNSCKKRCKTTDIKSNPSDTSTAWPYNYLHDTLDVNSSLNEQILHWYKYKFANILYAGYYCNRLIMKSCIDKLCQFPDIFLILTGPIIIKLLIIVATFCGVLASIFSLIGVINIKNNQGTQPNGWITTSVIVMLLICAPCAYFIPYLILKILFLIPIILICGLLGLLLCFMPMFLMFSSIFSLLYPLYFDKGKSAFEKLANNKDILSLLYAAGVCILATINLNITVASTMWVGWAILAIMKIISFLTSDKK